MTLPASLHGLTTREAIIDSLYRILRGLDRNEIDLFYSAVTDDIEVQVIGDANLSTTGLSSVKAKIFDLVAPMDSSHVISNVRVDVQEGASNATLQCYCSAQHCPPGRGQEPDGPKFLGTVDYTLELVLDQASGLWKIQKWVLDRLWLQGDPSVMMP